MQYIHSMLYVATFMEPEHGTLAAVSPTVARQEKQARLQLLNHRIAFHHSMLVDVRLALYLTLLTCSFIVLQRKVLGTCMGVVGGKKLECFQDHVSNNSGAIASF